MSVVNHYTKILLAGLAICAISSVQAQTLYKWVDGAGKTHYSDKPPAAGQAPKGEQTIAKRSFNSSDALSAQRSLAKKEVEQTKGSKSAKEAESEAQAALDREKQREKNCVLAREASRVLGSGGRVSVTDEKGEKRFLEDKEVSERLADMQRREQEACSPASAAASEPTERK